MTKVHLPLIGVLVSFGLFVAAASCYPGGTTFSSRTVGYEWTGNFICSLFRPTAINGAVSPSRYFAIPALGFYCLSMGFVFKSLSANARSTVHRKLIEIGGIGNAVYTFLVITPMHDLMVTISLLFFLTTTVTLLYLLYIEGNRRLFAFGVFCMAQWLGSAVIYYGNVLWVLLPAAQKLMMVSTVVWLFAIYYAQRRLSPAGSVHTQFA